MLYDKKWDAKIETDEIKTVLTRAREILAEESRWTKGCWSRTADGKEGMPGGMNFSMAASYCISGAIYAAAGCEIGHGFAIEFLKTIKKSSGFPGSWNDHPTRTHADVLALLDKAIAARD